MLEAFLNTGANLRNKFLSVINQIKSVLIISNQRHLRAILGGISSPLHKTDQAALHVPNGLHLES